MDARVDDSKSLLRYGIGDVWIGRSINPDVPACCRQIPGPRLIAVLARDRDCAVIARKRDIVAGAKVDFVLRRVLERIIRKVAIAPGRFPGQHCSVGTRSDPRSVFGVVQRILEDQRRSDEHTSELPSLMRTSYAV